MEAKELKDSPGPGNVIIVKLQSGTVNEIFTGYGAKNVPSHAVVKDVVAEVREYMKSAAPDGEHLADQLLIPMAMAGGGSFRCVKASMHTRTQKTIIEKFLPVVVDIGDKEEEEGVVVSVWPS